MNDSDPCFMRSSPGTWLENYWSQDIKRTPEGVLKCESVKGRLLSSAKGQRRYRGHKYTATEASSLSTDKEGSPSESKVASIPSITLSQFLAEEAYPKDRYEVSLCTANGIGIKLVVDMEKNVIVSGFHLHSPAENYQITVGDKLLAIEDVRFETMSLIAVTKVLQNLEQLYARKPFLKFLFQYGAGSQDSPATSSSSSSSLSYRASGGPPHTTVQEKIEKGSTRIVPKMTTGSDIDVISVLEQHHAAASAGVTGVGGYQYPFPLLSLLNQLFAPRAIEQSPTGSADAAEINAWIISQR